MKITKLLLPIVILFTIVGMNACKDKSFESGKMRANNGSSETIGKGPLSISNPVEEGSLRDAALEGNLSAVENYISKSININASDQDGRTALMLSAFDGHTSIVKALIDKGALVNLLDYSGRTALMYASTGPNVETVSLLLKAGAEVNIADNDERFTALMFAAAEGHLEVVKVLMDNKADLYLQDKDNDDAESFARQNGHIKVADYLKAYKK